MNASAFKGMLAILALAAWGAGGDASAQAWPSGRPVTIVMGVAPASTTDIIGRLVAEKLGPLLGQSIIVDNRPGASGNIATQYVKRAASDGYTIMLAGVPFVINAALQHAGQYDPVKDFMPVILGPSTANLIAVHPSIPASNLKELIEVARKNQYAYASSGIGTTTHLMMEQLKLATGIDIIHVPFAPAAAVIAAIAGHAQVSSTSIPPTVAHVKSGKLRPIAVTGSERSPALPDVPTIAEAGFPGLEATNWWGFLVTAGTPSAVVERLNTEINKSLEMADVKASLAKQGLSSKPNRTAEFASFYNNEVLRWAKTVKDSGIKPQ